ncbi:hypothetical protein RRF57_007285 [Xylaria bambusicola]|uniref:FAD-binding domain-containing protein n=1 Tax=Xylaria bambusicola TaxID=326684 RepID=A0AAN7UTF4_9PEZI
MRIKMPQSKFRAIIIGGGPIGLTIANGLDRAGIDFLVIERNPNIISESGAGIMAWPHTTRIFDQLGLTAACQGRYIPLQSKSVSHLDGRPIRANPVFKYLSDNHGYPCMNFPRPLLTQTLYDGLGANQAKVRTGAGIENIEMTESGVRVRLTDNSFEDGSIVIGADGVHSKTRAIMQKLAEEAGEDFVKKEDPIVSSYQILPPIKYGRAKYIPGVKVGEFFETHGAYRSSQISADKDRMHFGIYRKLPNPTTELKKDYSEEELAEFVEAFSDVNVMPNLSFTELYKNCEWTKLVNQQEGVLKRWYYNRVVLAGDSTVQMTAAMGMGLNNGIQSAVFLVNKLQELLSKSSDPDAAALGCAFEEYQNTRREESQIITDHAAKLIRGNTWDTYLGWFMHEYVVPWMMTEEKLMAIIGEQLIRKMYKFDFIDAELKSGKIPWANA